MQVLADDIDEAAIRRVIRGLAPIHSIPRDLWPDVLIELRDLGLNPRQAGERIGLSRPAVDRYYRRLTQPPRTRRARATAPPPDPTVPLARDDRRAVLDVVAGRRQLVTLPAGHRWIAVHACRAQGMSTEQIIAHVGSSGRSVRRYLADPGDGARL